MRRPYPRIPLGFDGTAAHAADLDWLAEDPPTWEWEPVPGYMSLRARRIVRRYTFTWWQFTLRP